MCVCVSMKESERKKEKDRLKNLKGPTAPGQCEILSGELTEQIDPLCCHYISTFGTFTCFIPYIFALCVI